MENDKLGCFSVPHLPGWAVVIKTDIIIVPSLKGKARKNVTFERTTTKTRPLYRAIVGGDGPRLTSSSFSSRLVSTFFNRFAETNSEEDGGFGIGGEKTRFATLQRQKQQTNQDALRNFKNNISSLVRLKGVTNIESSTHTSIFQSQEVTYAELTLPRNNGYTPLRRAPPPLYPKPTALSPSDGASVIYASINHTSACPNQRGGSALQPLLISTSSGGISPSSLLNTSCDSSSTGRVATR